jgi:23S rRNA-/tRNA-specific pseudouridylate synthase
MLNAESFPDRILFHGDGILAFNKPAGIPIHRGTGHPVGLAEAIDAWARGHPDVLALEPGAAVVPLHRLDLEASGVALFGLARAARTAIQGAFAEGRIWKRYLAVIAGPVDATGTIEGKVRTNFHGEHRSVLSRLDYRRLAGDERLSLVEVIPHQGRTHQIRALFAGAGRPLAGDLRFGKPKPARQFLFRFAVPGFLLHARELSLPEGIIGAGRSFLAPVPETFRLVARGKGWEVPEVG